MLTEVTAVTQGGLAKLSLQTPTMQATALAASALLVAALAALGGAAAKLAGLALVLGRRLAAFFTLACRRELVVQVMQRAARTALRGTREEYRPVDLLTATCSYLLVCSGAAAPAAAATTTTMRRARVVVALAEASG